MTYVRAAGLIMSVALLTGSLRALAQTSVAITTQPATRTDSRPDHLPEFLTEGWEGSIWGWVGYDYLTHNDDSSIWVAQAAVDVTKTFNQRIAATVEVSAYDSNYRSKVLLEQAYVSILLSDQYQTMLTAGRFDANFGVEPRDYWNRLTGTSSLLFGAQPQQLTGAMLTQPLGNSGIKLKPFVTASFQEANVPHSPSVGVMVDYSPHKTFQISATNWFGPGFVMGDPGSSYYGDAAAQNWWGPSLDAVNGGSLYFFDFKAIWRPIPELTLCGEYLFANNFSSKGRFEWDGVMLLANYDVNDRFRVFGRWSFLNDPHWIVTGIFQRRHEISAGVTYQFYRDIETRAEYRHDFSSAAPDQDIFSINLSFGF
ncbi:MAG TPA: outer membrane beta-barrel protein [Tepidisphaeraceae bacterium]